MSLITFIAYINPHIMRIFISKIIMLKVNSIHFTFIILIFTRFICGGRRIVNINHLFN